MVCSSTTETASSKPTPRELMYGSELKVSFTITCTVCYNIVSSDHADDVLALQHTMSQDERHLRA